MHKEKRQVKCPFGTWKYHFGKNPEGISGRSELVIGVVMSDTGAAKFDWPTAHCRSISGVREAGFLKRFGIAIRNRPHTARRLAQKSPELTSESY